MSVTYLLERELLSAVGKGDSQVIKKTYTHVHFTSETSYIFFDLNLFCCPCDFLTPSIRWLPSSSTCLLHSTQKKSNFDQDHLFRAILTFSVNRYITYINISFILWILYPEVHSGRVMHYTFTATSLRIHSTHMASRKYPWGNCGDRKATFVFLNGVKLISHSNCRNDLYQAHLAFLF